MKKIVLLSILEMLFQVLTNLLVHISYVRYDVPFMVTVLREFRVSRISLIIKKIDPTYLQNIIKFLLIHTL